jgi:hypothetical protein
MTVRIEYPLGAALAGLRFEPTPTGTRAFLDSRRTAGLAARRIVSMYAVPLADMGATRPQARTSSVRHAPWSRPEVQADPERLGFG